MTEIQKIAVFQQNGSGEKKIKGIRQYGKDRFAIEIISIDKPLPFVLENSESYLPQYIEADLVLDFLKHPDLSYDLGMICSQKNIPVVSSGKKHRIQNVYTPPT